MQPMHFSATENKIKSFLSFIAFHHKLWIWISAWAMMLGDWKCIDKNSSGCKYALYFL